MVFPNSGEPLKAAERQLCSTMYGDGWWCAEENEVRASRRTAFESCRADPSFKGLSSGFCRMERLVVQVGYMGSMAFKMYANSVGFYNFTAKLLLQQKGLLLFIFSYLTFLAEFDSSNMTLCHCYDFIWSREIFKSINLGV